MPRSPWVHCERIFSSFSHKELRRNRESKTSHLTSLHLSVSLSLNLLYTLHSQTPSLNLSLLTPLTVPISLVLTATNATSLSLLLSFSFGLSYFSLSFLPPHHIIVERERLCWSRRHGSRTGHLVSVLWAFQSVSFYLFLCLFLGYF